MKNIALFISIILFPFFVMGGTYFVQISGIIYDDHSLAPVEGIAVSVSIPRSGVFAGFETVVESNNQGSIVLEVVIPKEITSSYVTVSLNDCSGYLITLTENFSFADPVVVFQIPYCSDNVAFCSADFSYQTAISDTEYTFFFTDYSSGNIDTWFWDFGDGTTSTLKNVSHTYSQPGFYDVSHAIATTDGSCSDTLRETIRVDSTDYYDCAVWFEPIYFSALSGAFQAYTESPHPTLFAWDFGDGTTAQGDFVFHTFPTQGSYIVTLTGEDTYNCTDSYILEVIVTDTLEPCEAWFVAETDSLHPFHVQFTDFSNGAIVAWQWDFGDGNTSALQNPDHFYNLNNTYHVKLTITDTLNQCLAEVVRDVVIDYSPECVADFNFSIDSLSHSRNHYTFENTSVLEFPGEIVWTFGDGETAFSWETSHIYNSPGNYEVCLQVTDRFGYCQETHCKTLTTPDYWNIGGFLFAGDFPINNPNHQGDTAIAYLYKKLSAGLFLYDTLMFHKYGYYYFTSLLGGEYLLKMHLSNESLHSGDYFPGYFPKSLKWGDASILSVHSDIFDCDTRLVSQATLSSGAGFITGRIVFKNDETKKSITPVPVLLYDSRMNAITYVITDSNGFFCFDAIPFGCYYLYAESTGDFSSPSNICLNESTPGYDDIVLEIFDENVTGISDSPITAKQNLFLFPVPTQATLTVCFESTVHTLAKVSVLNYAGQEVCSNERVVAVGLNRFEMSVENLPSGIYLLKIMTPVNSETHVSKFIRD